MNVSEECAPAWSILHALVPDGFSIALLRSTVRECIFKLCHGGGVDVWLRFMDLEFDGSQIELEVRLPDDYVGFDTTDSEDLHRSVNMACLAVERYLRGEYSILVRRF